MDYEQVRAVDSAVADALAGEDTRQEETLAMIASENHVSKAVLEAQGSALTNKYAEGYPGKRYYAGCEYADEVEQLAIDRAKELWGAEHVNVQPHSGTQANQAVYFATLDPGDKILSLDLTHGGHLSHGHPANFVGQFYEVEQYEVDPETGYLDYDGLAAMADEFEPDMIVSGYSAYPREVEWERIQDVADDVGAYHLADIAHITGLVAGFERREVDRLVGLRTRVGLDVDVFGTPEFLGAVDGELFDVVSVLTARIIALAGIAFGVLVGQRAALGFENSLTDVVLAGDHRQRPFLPGIFAFEGVCDRRVDRTDLLVVHV